METAPMLHLNSQQLAQLIGYCAAYRSYLWQHVLPTPERNQTVRGLQGLQGRLEKAQEQATVLALPLCPEEKTALTQLFQGMTQYYAAAPASEERTRTLGDLVSLRRYIERASRQTQTLETERRQANLWQR